MKIRKEKLLDNFSRGQIFEFIRENPGAHLRMIKNELKLQIGALSYHLKVLQKNQMILSKNDMNLKRFYKIPKDLKDAKPKISDVQKSIINMITEQPGLRAITIAKRLSINHSSVLYNLRFICEQGLAVPRHTSQGIKYYSVGKGVRMLGDDVMTTA
jgi:predicted transcriptional regulator